MAVNLSGTKKLKEATGSFSFEEKRSLKENKQMFIDTDVYKSNDKNGKMLDPNIVDDWFDNKKLQSVDVSIYLGSYTLFLKNVIMKDSYIIKDSSYNTIIDFKLSNLKGFRWVGSKPMEFNAYLKNGYYYTISFNNYKDLYDFMKEVVKVEIT